MYQSKKEKKRKEKKSYANEGDVVLVDVRSLHPRHGIEEYKYIGGEDLSRVLQRGRED